MQTLALILTGLIIGLLVRYLVQRLADKHVTHDFRALEADFNHLESIINDIKQDNGKEPMFLRKQAF